MIDNRTVGKTIATLRQAKGMTQQQLAAAMNVSHQAVSKWENGAALPDIQTLVELTQLFGITVEQLLNGEIPAEQPENVSAEENPIQQFGAFVNNVIDGIGSAFKPDDREPAATAEDDGSAVNAEQDMNAQEIDLQKLLQMAPFMSKGAVEEMLARCRKKMTAAEIARFAPFVESECLERLIRSSESEISWDTLRRIAPFLKKEAVDALARAVASGEKYVRPATAEINRAAEDVCRTLDDVSKRIGKGIDRAVRKAVSFGENAVNEVSRAFDMHAEEKPGRDERLAKLRRSAYECAIEDGRWDWLEAHIDEIQDDELRRKMCEKANAEGMKDWVCRNLGGYADDASIMSAISEGEWDWLGDHAWQFSEEMQRTVALAAAEAQKWEWLSVYSEQIDLKECAYEIASAAREAGEKMFAVQLARYDMSAEQVDNLLIDAVKAGDAEFYAMILDLVSAERAGRCAISLAKEGDWEAVYCLKERVSSDDLESLLEIAIAEGNFDAIDRLDDLLKKRDASAEGTN